MPLDTLRREIMITWSSNPPLNRALTVEEAKQLSGFYTRTPVLEAIRKNYPRDSFHAIGKRLPRTNFSRKDLRFINFTGSNLREADFTGSDVRGCIFDGCDLTGANFTHANAEKVSFSGAKTRYLTAHGANFKGAFFMRNDLSHSFGDGAIFDDAYMRETNFFGARFANASLKNTYTRGSNIFLAVLLNVKVEEAKTDPFMSTYGLISEQLLRLVPTPQGYKASTGKWQGSIAEFRERLGRPEQRWRLFARYAENDMTSEEDCMLKYGVKIDTLLAWCDFAEEFATANVETISGLAERWGSEGDGQQLAEQPQENEG